MPLQQLSPGACHSITVGAIQQLRLQCLPGVAQVRGVVKGAAPVVVPMVHLRSILQKELADCERVLVWMDTKR